MPDDDLIARNKRVRTDKQSALRPALDRALRHRRAGNACEGGDYPKTGDASAPKNLRCRVYLMMRRRVWGEHGLDPVAASFRRSKGILSGEQSRRPPASTARALDTAFLSRDTPDPRRRGEQRAHAVASRLLSIAAILPEHSAMPARTPRQTLLRQMARDEATRVVSDSTRAAIEKMAEEFARDMLKDPEFRQYLRDEATKAAREIARALREPPEPSE